MASKPTPSKLPIATTPCPRCSDAVTHWMINRALALAIYRCPCGAQFTVQLERSDVARSS